MKKTKRKSFIIIAVICLLVLAIVSEALAFRTLYYGSSGSDVKTLQNKLKSLGYQIGKTDGVFGSKTLTAVKSFQRANKLTIDGIVGSNTWKKLDLATGGSGKTTSTAAKATSVVTTNNDVIMLAKMISGEARGEIYTGQVAVGAVILNRVKNPAFPNSISGVLFEPGAFDAIRDGQYYNAPTNSAVKAARDAINGWDPTHGAIYYWNPATATSKWIWSRPIIARIGKHVFAK